jgi:hypothetical protein
VIRGCGCKLKFEPSHQSTNKITFNRDKVAPFGFRISEPYHGGIQHWHLLLLIPTKRQQTLVDTFEKHSLEEGGAQQRRFKIEYI